MITSTHEELNRRTSATTGRGRHEKKRTTMKRRARGFHPLHRRHSSTSFSRRTRRAIASRFKQARKKDRKTETEEAVRYEANRERERRKKERKTLGPPDVPPHFSSDLVGTVAYLLLRPKLQNTLLSFPFPLLAVPTLLFPFSFSCYDHPADATHLDWDPLDPLHGT